MTAECAACVLVMCINDVCALEFFVFFFWLPLRIFFRLALALAGVTLFVLSATLNEIQHVNHPLIRSHILAEKKSRNEIENVCTSHISSALDVMNTRHIYKYKNVEKNKRFVDFRPFYLHFRD